MRLRSWRYHRSFDRVYTRLLALALRSFDTLSFPSIYSFSFFKNLFFTNPSVRLSVIFIRHFGRGSFCGVYTRLLALALRSFLLRFSFGLRHGCGASTIFGSRTTISSLLRNCKIVRSGHSLLLHFVRSVKFSVSEISDMS